MCWNQDLFLATKPERFLIPFHQLLAIELFNFLIFWPLLNPRFNLTIYPRFIRVQKRALRITLPEYQQYRALQERELKISHERRNVWCVCLIKQMLEPSYKLHSHFVRKCSETNETCARTNPNKFYNFLCRTKRFKP